MNRIEHCNFCPNSRKCRNRIKHTRQKYHWLHDKGRHKSQSFKVFCFHSKSYSKHTKLKSSQDKTQKQINNVVQSKRRYKPNRSKNRYHKRHKSSSECSKSIGHSYFPCFDWRQLQVNNRSNVFTNNKSKSRITETTIHDHHRK